MKAFVIQLLSVILVILIAGSIQSVTADHLEPGKGIFKDEKKLNNTVTTDSKYQIYLQSVIRNEYGQLISVVERNAYGAYIPHKITDHVFDTLMGKKEIITIDNIKYEKVQYIFSPTVEQRAFLLFPIFTEYPIETKFSEEQVALMQSKKLWYPGWQIHYCGTFKGHGDKCIPVFQVMVPGVELESDDVVTLQWTIFRELN